MQASGPSHPHGRIPLVLAVGTSVDVGLAPHHRALWLAAQRVMDASSAWKHTPTGELLVNASKSRLDSPGATGV